MQNGKIFDTPVTVNISNGQLNGEPVVNAITRIADLKNVFMNEALRAQMLQDKIIYEVQAYMPEEEGTEGGLYFGTTIIHPGKVGDEYFMTRGHFHAKIDTAEFYWGVKGEGMLILMDKTRKIRTERMKPGSLHYISRGVAHRVANTGREPLIFNACWPSDAGHNYDKIYQNGFAARLIDQSGKPALVTV